ncbi:ABC transporter substrate-binding protein [Methanolobus bombayensis]|uniref:ABC transporter substrate-binding protein n=1 Tax=Methanolobus bombayensis TaxID=38023 RepID=UPI001AEB845D|nr:ABC transporter substrate-binding protein [Methanolobus bombayensis]MBP1908869.1 peptide/nickel transport system substrate-binding protein [Methanolobus bombayensis]
MNISKIKERIKVPLLVLILITAVVAGSLCIDQDDSGTDTVESGSHLNCVLAQGPSDSLDPASKWVGWYVREFGIYETLFSYDENMVLQPELATGYEQVSDTEWKIILRDGVKFHDGTIMDADSVVYSLKRVLNSENSRKSEYDFIDSITSESANTITITTKYPYAPTIASLTDPIMSIVSPEADDIKNSPVGTGPFKFKSYEREVSISLQKFDDYWNGASEIDTIDAYIVGDGMTRLFMLESGDADISRYIPQSEVSNIESNEDFEITSKETLRSYFLYINMNKEPFNDVNFRQAMNHAIDRQQIVDVALEGIGGTPAESVFPSVSQWSINDELEVIERNETMVKELLAEAGLEDIDNDGYLEYNGEDFEISIYTYTSRPQLKPSAEVIVTQFESVGLKTSLTTMEGSAIEAKMVEGDYDLALYAWGVAPTGDPDYFFSKHFYSSGTEAQKTGYSNEQVDQWIDDAKKSSDEDLRKEYYDNVQRQILEDCPEIYIFYQNAITGYDTKVGGYKEYPNEITILTKDIYLNE